MVQGIERPPTLTSVVVDAIRDGIFRGEMLPGEALREVALSDSLQVSRGTVREALHRLEDDGLVRIIPHKGAFVQGMKPCTAREVYTLRAVLEPYAVRLAMERDGYTRKDLDRFEKLGRRIGELEDRGGSTYEIVKADVEFHRLICLRSRHRLLLKTMKSLQSMTRLFVFNNRLHRSEGYRDDPSHLEIALAIRQGSPERAANLLRLHIMQSGEVLLSRMLAEEGRGA